MDQCDPYWYSRLVALKAVYIAVILFIANMFLQPPLASLIMLIAAAGVLLTEMPTINDLNKKDNIYLGYIILICLTIVIFASYVYFKVGFIVAATAWCYILYSLLKKTPQLFPVVSLLMILGVMSLEAVNTGNFYVILNEVIFILEFALIVFWAHKLFPNLYHKIWLSATLRTLENLQKTIDLGHVSNGKTAFQHYLTARSSLNLIKTRPYLRQAVKVTHYLSYYQYYLLDLVTHNKIKDLSIIRQDLNQLHLAICLGNQILLAEILPTQNNVAPLHNGIYTKLVQNWNKICVHINN